MGSRGFGRGLLRNARFVVLAKAIVLVIPAKAGIQLLASVFRLSAEASSPLNPTLSSRRKPGSICCCFALIGRFLLKHIRVFFRPPSWRTGHFSLLAQREVTKRKGTPAVAVAGHRARRLREAATGFADGTSLCRQRTRRDPSRRPLRGFFLRALTAAEGDPEEQRSGPPVRRSGASLRSLQKNSRHSDGHAPSFRRRPESSISL